MDSSTSEMFRVIKAKSQHGHCAMVTHPFALYQALLEPASRFITTVQRVRIIGSGVELVTNVHGDSVSLEVRTDEPGDLERGLRVVMGVQ